MLDMAEDDAADYISLKEMERNAEIKILEHSLDASADLASIKKAAQRIVLLKRRHMMLFNAMNHFAANAKEKSIWMTGEPHHAAGGYYGGMFASAVIKKMLDEWDAEDEQTMQKEGAHE